MERESSAYRPAAAALEEANDFAIDRVVAALVNQGVGDWARYRLALSAVPWRS